MRASFFASLVILATTTAVSAVPIEARNNIPVFSLPKGGNAGSGYSGSVDGGNAINSGYSYVGNSAFANAGGNGGVTVSGYTQGGNGLGGGGTAASGSTGSAYGGNAANQANVITNGFAANQGGNGGVAISGAAIGGNAWKRNNVPVFSLPKGGDAGSGYSGSVDGGNAINSGSSYVGNSAFANAGGNGGLLRFHALPPIAAPLMATPPFPPWSR